MKETNEMQKKVRFPRWKWIAVLLMIFDVAAIMSAYFMALWLRFDFHFSEIPQSCVKAFLYVTPIYAVCTIVLFWLIRGYRSVWRYAGFPELIRFSCASLAASLVYCGVITIFERMPISFYLIGSFFQLILLVGIRFSYRFVVSFYRRNSSQDKKNCKRVMVIGAGLAGATVIKEMFYSDKINLLPVCIIDDNEDKWNCYVEGVPVVGGRNDILLNVQKYQVDQIIYCIPSISATERRNILNICNETGCELKVLPGIYQLATGEVLVSKLKPVAVEDLLGRDVIKVNMDEIYQFIQGKTILVTGGGGSIGSELCRQIASHSPKRLIIFDVYENNAYDIEQELRRKYPQLDLVVLIGSVRDSRRINRVFEDYRPEVVYHAAAHKHVPLMETSPCESIKNNVMGTYKTALAALLHGCQRFVLISTDKAVNPTNIMGASKRLCEMVIQSMDKISRTGDFEILRSMAMHEESDETWEAEAQRLANYFKTRENRTEFVAVRFGNVLGSNGSVIPLFKKQIEEGGPITVTHPDIIRYFMTIPEAVNLVLQAGTYAEGGEIYVLDMGEPVKIDTLARNLIKLAGYKPDVDIQIVYTGLRPGEKLFEEKLMAEEGLKLTPNKLIHIGQPIPFDVSQFFIQLGALSASAYNNDPTICKQVAQIVGTFHVVVEEKN